MIMYKCFNADMTNRYGQKFEVGKKYRIKGAIKFGIYGNGFHVCKNTEDTFRYFDSNNFCLCEVIASGKTDLFEDEYYGFYDMYVAKYIEIIRILSREEIIKYMLDNHPDRVIRFIRLFKLYDEEIVRFENKFRNCKDVIDNINYYQHKKMKSLYIKTIYLNSLVFDIKRLPIELDKSNIFDPIVKLRDDKQLILKKFRNSIELGVALDNFSEDIDYIKK